MNSNPTPPEPKATEQSMKARGIIFAIVGAASGVFAAMKLASVLPLWVALLIAFMIWVIIVTSLTFTLGSELFDILVGSVTIIVVMMVVVPAFARSWQRKHQKNPPAPQSYIEMQWSAQLMR